MYVVHINTYLMKSAPLPKIQGYSVSRRASFLPWDRNRKSFMPPSQNKVLSSVIWKSLIVVSVKKSTIIPTINFKCFVKKFWTFWQVKINLGYKVFIAMCMLCWEIRCFSGLVEGCFRLFANKFLMQAT